MITAKELKFQPIFLNLNEDFWKGILQKENTLRTTYVMNATKIFKPLSYYLSKNNVKTDIFWLSRYDREAAAKSRYELYQQLSNGIIDKLVNQLIIWFIEQLIYELINQSTICMINILNQMIN